MGEDTHISSCGRRASDKPNVSSHKSHQMHLSPNALFVGSIFAACLWGMLLLAFCSARYFLAYDPSASMAMASAFNARTSGSSLVHFDSRRGATLYEELEPSQHALRISTSDLLEIQTLERNIQLAAFQQFDSHKTGRLYNVSVPGLPLGNVLAIRLRSGSFRKHGVNISEFTIPEGCFVDPKPERILLVYARLVNTSLFKSVPAGLVLTSPVLSVLVYDAANLNSSQPPEQLSVATTSSLIYIGFQESLDARCAYFAYNTTAVNITDSVQGVCQVNHLGTFALVSSELTPTPSPTVSPSPATSKQKKHSNVWKIVVGSVVGGLVLLAFVSLLALGIGKRRMDGKISRMEYQADQGETLQVANIRNSRVPSAGNTRTQATLVYDYAV